MLLTLHWRLYYMAIQKAPGTQPSSLQLTCLPRNLIMIARRSSRSIRLRSNLTRVFLKRWHVCLEPLSTSFYIRLSGSETLPSKSLPRPFPLTNLLIHSFSRFQTTFPEEDKMYKSKRNMLTILISLTLVILTACAPAATPAPTAAPAQPQATAAPTEAPATVAATEAPTVAPASAANTLTIDSNIDDLITLDPAVAYEFSGILVVHNVYETLVKFEGSDLSTLKAGLAAKCDLKDPGDNWELTLTLTDGLKFASGNPLTADDVA